MYRCLAGRTTAGASTSGKYRGAKPSSAGSLRCVPPDSFLPFGVRRGRLARVKGAAAPYRGSGGCPPRILFSPFWGGVGRQTGRRPSCSVGKFHRNVPVSGWQDYGGSVHLGEVQRGRSPPLPGAWGCPPDSPHALLHTLPRAERSTGRDYSLCRTPIEWRNRGSAEGAKPASAGGLEVSPRFPFPFGEGRGGVAASPARALQRRPVPQLRCLLEEPRPRRIAGLAVRSMTAQPPAFREPDPGDPALERRYLPIPEGPRLLLVRRVDLSALCCILSLALRLWRLLADERITCCGYPRRTRPQRTSLSKARA